MTTNAREEIGRLATAMIAGSIGIVEGCREMVCHLREAGLSDDPDAVVIRGVESETDDLPVGSERSLWDPAALASKDLIREEYLNKVTASVLAASRSLLKKLNPNGS